MGEAHARGLEDRELVGAGVDEVGQDVRAPSAPRNSLGAEAQDVRCAGGRSNERSWLSCARDVTGLTLGVGGWRQLGSMTADT